MGQIIVIKPGSISDDSIKLLESKGIVVIQHNKPQDIRVINSFDGCDAEDVFQSAMLSIANSYDSTKILFGDALAKRIIKK